MRVAIMLKILKRILNQLLPYS